MSRRHGGRHSVVRGAAGCCGELPWHGGRRRVLHGAWSSAPLQSGMRVELCVQGCRSTADNGEPSRAWVRSSTSAGAPCASALLIRAAHAVWQLLPAPPGSPSPELRWSPKQAAAAYVCPARPPVCRRRRSASSSARRRGRRRRAWCWRGRASWCPGGPMTLLPGCRQRWGGAALLRAKNSPGAGRVQAFHGAWNLSALCAGTLPGVGNAAPPFSHSNELPSWRADRGGPGSSSSHRLQLLHDPAHHAAVLIALLRWPNLSHSPASLAPPLWLSSAPFAGNRGVLRQGDGRCQRGRPF